MIKIGNVCISPGGTLVRGVQYSRSIKTFVTIFALTAVSCCVFVPILSTVWLGVPALIVTLITFIVFSISLITTSVMDPGILPPPELQDHFNMELMAIFKRRQGYTTSPASVQEMTLADWQELVDNYVREDTRQQFRNSNTYKLIQETHDVTAQELTFLEKGYNIPYKYCSTCRFFRPLRSVHSSKSGVCIQRYDHFCDWIGTDVGLHNHASFLVMIHAALAHECVQLVSSAVSLAVSAALLAACSGGRQRQFCPSTGRATDLVVEVPTWLQGLGLAVSALMFAVHGYIINAVAQLVRYHRRLLATNTLTKEDSGGLNVKISQMYNTFSYRGNVRGIFRGCRQPRILRIYCRNWNSILRTVRKNMLITNFEQLGSHLRLHGYQQQFSRQYRPPAPASGRLLMMSDDGGLEQVRIEQVDTGHLLTRKDCFEYAINRARQTVLQTCQDVQNFRQQHPDVFAHENEFTPVSALDIARFCQSQDGTTRNATA